MTHQDPAGPPVMPPPPPSAPAPDSNRNVMVVLAYLWLLALVPLLAEKNDREVQWHAKHGLVLLVAEIIVWVVYGGLSMIPGVGCVLAVGMPLIWLAFIAVRVVCIVKGVNGQRFLIPGLSDFADKL
ncbi:MAG: hypothetical protein ACOY3Y_03845 [Acidobacteriota bacterium]